MLLPVETTTTNSTTNVSKTSNILELIAQYLGLSPSLLIVIFVACGIIIIAIIVLACKLAALRSEARKAALIAGLGKPGKVREFVNINCDKYDSEFGYMDFMLSINSKKQKLYISSISASNMKASNDDTPDCYIAFFMRDNKNPDIKKQLCKTEIINDSFTPFFDKKISFKIPIDIVDLQRVRIVAQLYDYNDVGNDILLGETEICLSNYDIDDLFGKNYGSYAIFHESLECLGCGEVCVILTLSGADMNVVKITILEAKDLKFNKQVKIGKPYPTVQLKLAIYVGNKKKKEMYTRKIENTANPYIKEDFEVKIPLKLLTDSYLKITVFELGIITKKIGSAYIGISKYTNRLNPLGNYHWNQMIDNGCRPVSMWHALNEK